MEKTAALAPARPRYPDGRRPEFKGNHSLRFRNDTWDDVKDAVKASTVGSDTEWVTEAVETRLGYVLCDRGRCGQRVPLRFGNLGGGPIDPWIALARRAVAAQDCRAHEPVTVGIGE